MANIKDLNDSKTEALQALFNSLSNPSDSINGKLSQEQLQKLSSKVDEILGGDDGKHGANRGTTQLVNEDGLPIVDITEPVGQSVTTDSPQDDNITDGPDLLPLHTLSPEERESRRIERERLLDLLEEEERAEHSKEEADEEERRRKVIEKRKEESKAEIEQLKATKEMHKKMGKALLKNVAEAREKEEAAKRKLLDEEQVSKLQNKSIKPKKSVTFAEGTEEKDGGTKLAWGDVVPARLHSSNRIWDKSADRSSTMKRQVVERFPGGPSTPIEPSYEADSDDESPTEEPPYSSEEDDSEDDSEEEPDIDSGDDWDSARHQREIALEYYEKKHAVGSEAARVMSSHTHDDEWDQPEVPLEATLAGRPKSGTSRFKAERSGFSEAKSESNPATPTTASTSIGFATIPASGQSAVRKAVKVGKLEGGQLMGGSDSEPEDETTTNILDMLKKGQIQNAGPDFVPPMRSPSTSITRGRPSPLPLAKGKTKDQNYLDVDLLTRVPQTPVNHIIRSSPKVSTFDLPTSGTSHDHHPVSGAGSSSKVQPARLTIDDSLLAPSNPQPSDKTNAYSPCLSSASTAVDSPVGGEEPQSAFSWNNPPVNSSTPSRPPIIVSSSVQESSSSRPTRPPVVSASVQESSRRSDPEPQLSNDGPKKRVSKFKAERM